MFEFLQAVMALGIVFGFVYLIAKTGDNADANNFGQFPHDYERNKFKNQDDE